MNRCHQNYVIVPGVAWVVPFVALFYFSFFSSLFKSFVLAWIFSHNDCSSSSNGIGSKWPWRCGGVVGTIVVQKRHKKFFFSSSAYSARQLRQKCTCVNIAIESVLQSTYSCRLHIDTLLLKSFQLTFMVVFTVQMISRLFANFFLYFIFLLLLPFLIHFVAMCKLSSANFLLLYFTWLTLFLVFFES